LAGRSQECSRARQIVWWTHSVPVCTPAPETLTGERPMRVEVAYAEADAQTVITLELDAGATVAEALAAVADRHPFVQLELASVPVGVFGDRADRDRPLMDGDRLEIYRPLVIDPRQARQRRAASESQARLQKRSPNSARNRR
jgi:uncharacterized protein